jgi:hypothetical protein
MYIGLHVKYRLFMPDCNETFSFLDSFDKYCMKVRPVGAEMFHMDGQTDGRTDKTKLTVNTIVWTVYNTTKLR